MDIRQATDHKSSRGGIHHSLLLCTYRLSPTSTSHEQAAKLFCQKMETIPKLWIVSSVGGKMWHLPAPICTSSPLHDERGQNIAQYTVRHPLSRES